MAMAAAQEPRDIDIIPLTKDSCCGYCFAGPGEMEEPRALPCGHAACTECIKIDNRRLDLQCKICKAQFDDVLDVTKQLPLIPESYIEAATAEIEEEETTPGLPCNICKDNPLNSVVCCTTCKRRFCDHHAKEHLLHTGDHKLIPIQYELTPERYKISQYEDHPNHLLDEICKNCDHMFCNRCVVKDSRCPIRTTHTIVPIKQVTAGIRKQFNMLTEEVYKKMKRCRNIEKSALRRLSDYEEYVETIHYQIDESIEQMIRDIRNEGRDLKNEFTQRLQQTSKGVKQFPEDMLTNLANLDGLFRTGEELAERSSDAEVIRDYKQLKQELTDGVQDKAMESKFVIPRLFLKKGASHIPRYCTEDQSHNHDVQQYMTSLEHPFMLVVDCPSTVTEPDTSQQHHFVMDDETDLLDESESKGIRQDEGNDDRSICSESSTESIISRLCSLHGTIQQSLRDSLADKSWMHVTSTIASHSYQDQIESILMLATDFRESIVDYRDTVNDHTLKVTATHFQSQDLHKRIKQISSLSTTLEGSTSFLASCVTTKVPEKLPSDKHGLLQLIEQAKPIQNNSSVLNGVQVEILFEQIPLLSVRVLSENAEVMTVRGIFEVESPPDPFEDLMVSLNDLNLTTDSQDVTVLAMLWENSIGEQHALFKYTAGAQLDLPEERSDSYQLTSRQLKNDKLHELIRKNSKHMLSQNMTSDRIEAWEKESPLFIVTSEVPDSACDDIADMLIQPEWMDNKEESGGRSVLLFRHPTEMDTEIEVTEPASPAKVTTRRGRNTTTMQIGHDSHSANQHPLTPANKQPKKANPRINRTTRTLLEKKQSLVYRTLRQLHKMDGNLDDAVTAVIVTSTLDPEKVEPGIVLVAGILRPKGKKGKKDKNYLLKGDDNAGVIISIHWLFSRPLKASMRQAWETFSMKHPGFPNGINITLFISHSDLNNYSTQQDNSHHQGHTLHNFIFPVIRGGRDFVIEPSVIVPEFKFQTMQGSQYRIIMNMTYGREETTLCLSDAVISYETGLLRFEEEKFRLSAAEILEMKLDKESESPEAQVTVCVHHISSITKDHIRSIDIYLLVTAGGPSELDLPTRFLYHDPLHVWKCHTWTTNSPALAQRIKERWPGGVQDTANTVAKHVIYLGGKEIPLEHKDGDVRYANPPLVLEVWSHINKPKAILNKLLDEELDFNDLMRDRIGNQQRIRNKIADCLDEDRKPKSSQFPTTHFRLCQLAKPNQMGSASSTLQEHDVNNNPAQTESQQRNRHTTGDSRSTRHEAEAEINRGGSHSELAGSQCSENPSVGHDQAGASQSDKTGTRPKQRARGDSLPSKHKLREEAKGLPSILLHMENEDVSHIKFARPGVEPRIISVDDVMVCVHAMSQ